MKKLIISALMLGATTISASAEGFYWSGSGGINFTSDTIIQSKVSSDRFTLDYKEGFLANTAIGYRFNPQWRAEFEFGFRKNKLENIRQGASTTRNSDSHIKQITYMLNGYYDIDINDQNWVPYVGLGLGAASIKITDTSDSSSDDILKDTVFAVQAMLGVTYKIDQNLDTFAQYTLLTTNSYEKQTATASIIDEAHNHSIGLGLRYNF